MGKTPTIAHPRFGAFTSPIRIGIVLSDFLVRTFPGFVRTMSDPNRIRRQQILREAEGYLDLITVFGDRMPCRPDARDMLARRVLKTLDRIDHAGGLKAHVLFLRGQALRAMDNYIDAVP